VITTASEFTGSGEVEGPGTGVSDSIPARLSDGEFVFTKKATDQMGADNLQEMMDDAERAYDGGMMRSPKKEGGMLMYKQKDENPLDYEKIAQDEIKKNMLRANRAPSLLGGN
jgi:phage-related minor tail protein